MNIKRLLYGPYSSYIISIILGFGLATIFRKVCNKRDCVVHKAVPIDIINEKIFKYNDKCYKFKASAETCNKDKQILDIA
tara:strand:- start:360 stop:599 length:240 start_codon:yes stop_codon:yes gene_type:complete